MENSSSIIDLKITEAAIAEAEAEVAASVAGTEKAPWQGVPLGGDPVTVEAVKEIFRLRDVRIALNAKYLAAVYSGKSARDASAALRAERSNAEVAYAARKAALQEQIDRYGLKASIPGERNAVPLHDEALARLQGLEAAISRYRVIEEQSAYQADMLEVAGLLLDKRIADASGRARKAQARAKAKAR